jgi:hypothetical protein
MRHEVTRCEVQRLNGSLRLVEGKSKSWMGGLSDTLGCVRFVSCSLCTVRLDGLLVDLLSLFVFLKRARISWNIFKGFESLGKEIDLLRV